MQPEGLKAVILDWAGTVVDFGSLKRAIAEECAALDHRMLLPADCPQVEVEQRSDGHVEAALALAAAQKTGLPVVVSFTFDTGKNKDRTMTGATPEQAAHQLTEAGASVIGANCGVGIGEYIPICRRLRAATVVILNDR